MKPDYLENSYFRLGSLFKQQTSFEKDLADQKQEGSNILAKYKPQFNQTARVRRLLAQVVRRKGRVAKLLQTLNAQREMEGEYAMTEEEAEESADAENPLKRHQAIQKLELRAVDERQYNGISSLIASLNLKISMIRFQIGDILCELGLRGIEEEDLSKLQETILEGSIEEYKKLVEEIRLKISGKVALVLAGYEEKRYLLMQPIPGSSLEQLAFPMASTLEQTTLTDGDILAVKVGEFSNRMVALAKLVLSNFYDPQDKNKALRNFREGVSSIFSADKISSSLADFLMIFRTMESSPVGQALLENFDLTQLFDLTHPIIMLGLTVHFSKHVVDQKKLFAIRKLMLADESTMTKADWVKLFQRLEDLDTDEDAEANDLVAVIIKQFINAAIYTASKEGDYVYFNSGSELTDPYRFVDHRRDDTVMSDRIVVNDLDDVFNYLPDRVRLVLEAVKDYNCELFEQILMTFYENAIWFRAIGKGSIKSGLKQLWGKKAIKMHVVVEDMLTKAGVYQDGTLLAFKDKNYGSGVAQLIANTLAASGLEADEELTGLVPGIDEFVSTNIPKEASLTVPSNPPKEAIDPAVDNPFDL